MGQSIRERSGAGGTGSEVSGAEHDLSSTAADRGRPTPVVPDPVGLSQAVGVTVSATRDASDARPGKSEQEDASQLAAGTVVGRYVILDKIAAGGMGAVYKAFDPELDRKVAVKVVAVAQGDSPASTRAAARLVREAKSLAQLSHPNVIAVYDVGAFGEDVFIAMALVEGQTLRAWNKSNDRSVAEIVAVYAAAGRGLAAAHRAGIVHRDFKPDNVLVGDDGRVQVVDFGIALAEEVDHLDTVSGEFFQTSSSGEISRASSDAFLDSVRPSPRDVARLTKAGALVGTPAYMSPEQFLASNVDAKTDQFSFCVALYEALYGSRPFKGRRVAVLQRNVVAGNIRKPDKDSGIPARLRRIVERGLSVSPDDRYPSMEDLLDDLCHDPAVRRRRWLAAAVVIASVTIALVATVGSDDAGTRCRAAGQAVNTVWSPQARRAVEKAFANADASYAADTAKRVRVALSERARAWATTRQEVCEATWVRGEQSEILMDKRMECLDRRLNEMTSLIELFSAEVDRQLVGRAVQAVSSLDSVEGCSKLAVRGTPFPVPNDPATRERIAALQKRIDSLSVMMAAGRHKQAVTTGNAVLAEADALDYAPLQAEVLYIMGLVLDRTNDGVRSEAAYARGLLLAATAGDDRLVSLMASQRIGVISYLLDRPAEALALVPGAEVAAIRAGRSPDVQEALLDAIGTAYFSKHDYPSARNYFERRLELLQEIWKKDDPRMMSPLNNLGRVLNFQNEFNGAIRYLERARDVCESALGPDHPSVAVVLNNLGMAYHGANRDSDAIAAYHRARAVFEDSYGSEHPYVAAVLYNLADVLLPQGNIREAERYYRQTLATVEKGLGPRHRRTGIALTGVGGVLNAQGKFKQALSYYRRAVAVLDASVGNDKFMGVALLGIGRAHLGLGDRKAAREPLEGAVRILQGKRAREVPEAQFVLARALWPLPEQRKRALALATDARSSWSSRGNADDKVSEVDSWLRSLPAP